VVRNGLALTPCEMARNEWREKLEISEQTIVATMVANFRPQKDHPTLLHAWKKILTTISNDQARPHLLLAGAPQDSYHSVYQLANSLGLLDSVSFLGQVKDVAGLLTASDIGILTTSNEGLPNAILEYMASGLPVVATDLPGNREALGDDPQQLFCKPGDADSIASQLQVLLHNPDLRREFGTRNRQRALTNFSIDKMCKTTASIIIDLLIKASEDT
jgi:glycosyltransferase involved in cell wall biosynthesis